MLGDSLSKYKNLQVVEASSPQLLVEILGKIKINYEIVGFDNDGDRFYAYINPSRKIKIKKTNK